MSGLTVELVPLSSPRPPWSWICKRRKHSFEGISFSGDVCIAYCTRCGLIGTRKGLQPKKYAAPVRDIIDHFMLSSIADEADG